MGEASAWLELDGVKVAVQFDSAGMQHRRKGGHNEMLGRAVGLKADRKPLIWDATGGLGRDAFVLADLGCEVTLCERVPVLAWLLEQAVQAAAVSGVDQVRAAAERMVVQAGDSKMLRAPAETVIYLDPMFPERKKAAAVKKEAAMLQHLADPVDDCETLWQWAWDQPVEGSWSNGLCAPQYSGTFVLRTRSRVSQCGLMCSSGDCSHLCLHWARTGPRHEENRS